MDAFQTLPGTIGDGPYTFCIGYRMLDFLGRPQPTEAMQWLAASEEMRSADPIQIAQSHQNSLSRGIPTKSYDTAPKLVESTSIEIVDINDAQNRLLLEARALGQKFLKREITREEQKAALKKLITRWAQVS